MIATLGYHGTNRSTNPTPSPSLPPLNRKKKTPTTHLLLTDLPAIYLHTYLPYRGPPVATGDDSKHGSSLKFPSRTRCMVCLQELPLEVSILFPLFTNTCHFVQNSALGLCFVVLSHIHIYIRPPAARVSRTQRPRRGSIAWRSTLHRTYIHCTAS